MKIRTIEVAKTVERFYAPGLKEWVKKGIVAEITEDDNYDECDAKLQEMVDQKLNLQHQPTDNNTGETLQEQPVDRRIGLIADDILSAPDLKTLESYKLLVKAKPELQGAYDMRLAYFQKSTSK